MDKSLQIIRNITQDYNSIAEEWDTSRFRPSKIKTKTIGEIASGMRVLDVGCGNGLMIDAVLNRDARYWGIDISSKLVRIAAQKYSGNKKNVNLRVGNAIKLPYQDNNFDFVFSFAVLHHIPTPKLRQKFFDETFRVLKKNSKAVIVVWNLLADWPRKRFDIDTKLEQVGDSRDLSIPWKATANITIERFIHLFVIDELEQFAKNSGFNSIKVDYYSRDGEKKKNGEEIVISLVK